MKRWKKELRRHAEEHGLGMISITFRTPMNSDENWYEHELTGPTNSSQIERLQALLAEFDAERKTFPNVTDSPQPG